MGGLRGCVFVLCALVGTAWAGNPTFVMPPTPCGSTVTVYEGVESRIPIVATTPNAGATVTVASTVLPAGASFGLDTSVNSVPGSTTTYLLRWTPQRTATTSAISFVAVDSTAATSLGNCVVTLSLGTSETWVVSGIVRDFLASGDFGRTEAQADTAISIVAPALGSDRKPAFAPSATPLTIGSASTFAQWWNDDASANRRVSHTLVLGNGLAGDPRIFGFESSSFFPIDGQGFGDNPNRYFTYEIHNAVAYAAGEQLVFRSSDDLWVFVNGKLAVALGGVHDLQTQTLDLDSFAAANGLVAGTTYPIDIFFAHRGSLHTPALTIQTARPAVCADNPLASVPLTALAPLGTGLLVSSSTFRLARSVSLAGAGWLPGPINLATGFRAELLVTIPAGAEGAAIVLAPAQGLGAAGSDLGYAGLRNLAIELDANMDAANGDPSVDHIALHSRGALGNSANELYSLGTGLLASASAWEGMVTARVTVEYRPTPAQPEGWLRVWAVPAGASPSPTEPILETPVDQSYILANTISNLAYLGIASANASVAYNVDLVGLSLAETDTDHDNTVDCNDGCPMDGSKQAPGVCGCGVADIDTDGDGTADCNETCDTDPLKTSPGICGCGVADTDTDGDGTADCNDGCPMDASKQAPGMCGCGVADTDTDGDGTADCNETCDTDPLKTAPGICGCGVSDVDSDGDGTPDCHDVCSLDPLKTGEGVCGCGESDVDSDGDLTPDCIDSCKDDPAKSAVGICGCGVPDDDSDGDLVVDCIDKCPDDPDKSAPGKCGCGVPEVDGTCEPPADGCGCRAQGGASNGVWLLVAFLVLRRRRRHRGISARTDDVVMTMRRCS